MQKINMCSPQNTKSEGTQGGGYKTDLFCQIASRGFTRGQPPSMKHPGYGPATGTEMFLGLKIVLICIGYIII